VYPLLKGILQEKLHYYFLSLQCPVVYSDIIDRAPIAFVAIQFHSRILKSTLASRNGASILLLKYILLIQLYYFLIRQGPVVYGYIVNISGEITAPYASSEISTGYNKIALR
jgi:hypothetical protein